LGNFTISNPDEKESMIGEVLEVGDPIKKEIAGTIDITIPCKKGDTIIYPKYHSSSFTWEGEEYKIIKHEDCLAVINE
jgi:co-chaperonin GroES (HSP10)